MLRTLARPFVARSQVIDVASRRVAVRSVFPFIGAGLHVGQIAFFWWLGMPGWLSLYSLTAIAFYVISVVLVRVGFPRTGMWVALLEGIAHLSTFTVLFGTGPDYLFFLGPLVIASYLVFGAEERAHRIACIGVSIAASIALIAWSATHAPLFGMTPFQSAAMSEVNVIGIMVANVAEIAWFAWVSDRAEAALAVERERAESLLRNVFPESIVRRLKESPGTIAESANDVAVLFADIVGFTPMAAKMTPTELVALLDTVFSRFDELADAFGLEKIKTIGDAYFVVGGIPEAHEDATGAMANMALAMRESIRAIAEKSSLAIDLRIGIARGPVVAGVIGRRRFAYDLWGDTVNTAARMESHGAPGEIHVTAEVRSALADRFAFESRGIVSIKGKGDMETYFLKRAKG